MIGRHVFSLMRTRPQLCSVEKLRLSSCTLIGITTTKSIAVWPDSEIIFWPRSSRCSQNSDCFSARDTLQVDESLTIAKTVLHSLVTLFPRVPESSQIGRLERPEQRLQDDSNGVFIRCRERSRGANRAFKVVGWFGEACGSASNLGA